MCAVCVEFQPLSVTELQSLTKFLFSVIELKVKVLVLWNDGVCFT